MAVITYDSHTKTSMKFTPIPNRYQYDTQIWNDRCGRHFIPFHHFSSVGPAYLLVPLYMYNHFCNYVIAKLCYSVMHKVNIRPPYFVCAKTRALCITGIKCS